MSLQKTVAARKKRRALRVRSKITGSLPRVSVFRSLNHIYAQVVDDSSHSTLASCSSLELDGLKGDKKAIAHAVGLELAKRALTKNVDKAVFDRGQFLYHGRVKSLAEGLREGGLQI